MGPLCQSPSEKIRKTTSVTTSKISEPLDYLLAYSQLFQAGTPVKVLNSYLPYLFLASFRCFMEKIFAFPHLSTPEFDAACSTLAVRFSRCRELQSDWLSADIVTRHNIQYFKITTQLPNKKRITSSKVDDGLSEVVEAQDDADQVCIDSRTMLALSILAC